jgi:hypothetical protein
MAERSGVEWSWKTVFEKTRPERVTTKPSTVIRNSPIIDAVHHFNSY